jgi:hypothetical protein
MDGIAADHELARLHAAVSRAGANLVQLEATPTWAMLGAASLTGASATRWTVARDALARRFVAHASVKAVVDAAATLRAGWAILTPGRLERLEGLLLGDSVLVEDVAVPVAARSLVSESRVAVRSTPDDVLQTMAAEFDLVAGFVADVSARWDVMAVELVAFRQRAERLRVALPRDDSATVALLETGCAEIDRLAAQLLDDPVSVDPAMVRSCGEHVADLERDVDQVLSIRDDVDSRLATLRRDIADIELAVDGCVRRHRHVADRFCAGSVPEPPVLEAWFEQRFDTAATAARDGQWRVAAEACAELDGAIAAATRAVADANEAYDTLLAQRDELRGRLAGYRAKAAELDCLEQPDVADLTTRIERELRTAPTDLGGARRLLGELQRAVTRVESDPGGIDEV